MKSAEATGINNITVEMMKADINMTVDALHDIFRLIWEEKRIGLYIHYTCCGQNL